MDAHLIQTVVLRTMKQAQYNPDNSGHFGLAHQAYAHFTSPIRRYPDLMVHRAIRHVLNGGTVKNFAYTHEDLASLGEHSSMTERRADEATRDAVSGRCPFCCGGGPAAPGRLFLLGLSKVLRIHR